MKNELSPRIVAAVTELEAAVEEAAGPTVQPNLLILINLRRDGVHAYYTGCSCMQCKMTAAKSAARVMADQGAAVAAAGQVH